MTENKVETLFQEAIIVGEMLQKNLQNFDKNNKELHRIHSNLSQLTQTIEEISLYTQEIKNQEVQKFSKMMKEQINRYYSALNDVNIDTDEIELLITRHNDSMQRQAENLSEKAKIISDTLERNGKAIIAAADTFEKGRKSFAWSFTFFFAGVVVGTVFLSVFPIASATKTFQKELKKRDTTINQLKEHYETNHKMIAFLKEHDITIRTSTTDNSWKPKSLRFSPIVLFSKKRVRNIDEIGGYTRIIFSKNKNKE